MLGSHICRFKSRGPQRVYRCDIDHSSPLVGIHAWQHSFGEQERGSEHKLNDLPPFCFWKLTPCSSPATARPLSMSMSDIVTRTPCRAKSRAIARPMPEAAPVTSATLPCKSVIALSPVSSY